MPASPLRTLLGTARVPFLLLTPTSIALGASAAAWSGTALDVPTLLIVLAGALAAHASVNMLNEWFDFRSGLDTKTARTPYSGGSGALPVDPRSASWVLAGGLAMLGVTLAAGMWLLRSSGWALLPLGLAGIVLVIAYTPLITHWPWTCLLAPGLGFGPLMVAGTAVALSGRHLGAAYAASWVPGMLVSGLLLLNQFPDVEPDRAVGRRHLPMLWGRPAAARVLAVLFASAYAGLAAAVFAGMLPRGASAGMSTLPLAWQVARGARRHADDIGALQAVMGRNVALVLLTPLAIVIGGWVWR